MPGPSPRPRRRLAAWVAVGLATAGMATAGVDAQPRRLSWSDFYARPFPKPQARIAYGPGAQQFGELWLPDGPGPYPTVVLIHGGCWTKSVAKLDIMNPAAEGLRRRGLAVWNLEYRGVDEAGGGYPGTLLDVGAGLDRLRGLARERRLDLTRVVVAGHSAGGHLALWAAGRPRIRSGPLQADAPLAVHAVVDIAGLPNLETDTATACGASPVDAMAGPPRPGGRYADTSPAHMLPLRVRTVIAHGDLDETVPLAVSRAYLARARAAGDAVELRVLPGAAHVEEIAPGTPGWDRIVPIVEGLAR